MSKRIDKSWLVFISIENSDHDRCVDLFSRPDGTYGFEAFRRDVEDRGDALACGLGEKVDSGFHRMTIGESVPLFGVTVAEHTPLLFPNKPRMVALNLSDSPLHLFLRDWIGFECDRGAQNIGVIDVANCLCIIRRCIPDHSHSTF
jgi:hypothetical protein